MHTNWYLQGMFYRPQPDQKNFSYEQSVKTYTMLCQLLESPSPPLEKGLTHLCHWRYLQPLHG